MVKRAVARIACSCFLLLPLQGWGISAVVMEQNEAYVQELYATAAVAAAPGGMGSAAAIASQMGSALQGLGFGKRLRV